MKSLVTALIGATVALAAPAAAQNIVTNPGFDNNGAGWTFAIFGTNNHPGFGHSGDTSASTGCVGAGCTSNYNAGAYFAQSLTTVANQAYDLSFWVAESGGPTSAFSVFWNGQLASAVTDPNNSSIVYNTRTGYSSTFRQFFVNGLVATGASTDLQVHGRQDPAGIFFDDVSVTAATAAVPEPATWGLMIAGFGLVGAAMRRRQTAVRFA